MFLFKGHFSTAQDIASDLTENFAYTVKTIDEFIDRFNFIKGTEFEKYLFINYPEIKYSREKIIYSIFNYKNKSFGENPDVGDFIKTILDTTDPVYINFSDSSWYALIECKVKYLSKNEILNLVLKVDHGKNNSYKWSIVSADAKFLGSHVTNNDSLSFALNNEYMRNRIVDQSRYFLHPVSHALGFMNIDELFSSKKNAFQEYIYEGPGTIQLDNLIKMVKKSEIKFVQVNTISYHFLQIDGWIVIVDYFNRDEKNSGWLINTLMKATEEQKRIYIDRHLHVGK